MTADATLELVPVGVGGAYARPGEAQSCYLVRAGSRRICLDLGAGALNRLQAHVRPELLDLVVITHMHPDHCVDLFALRVYMAWGPGAGRRVRVAGPRELRHRLAAFGGGDDGWDDAFVFEVLDRDGGEMALGDGIMLRYREVPHLKPTYAIRIDMGGRSVTYGADCGVCDELAELAHGTDTLVTECSTGAEPVPEGLPHLNADEAARIANRAGAGRLLLTHCYPEHDRDAALALARSVATMPVDWAEQDRAVAA